MVSGIIGIKIANGEFYPILEERSPVKKRLILTTVHDNQHSMQIDLFTSAEGDMTDALYIGSLVLDQLKQKPKGEPSIELIVRLDGENNITASAVDLDEEASSEQYVLNISLKSLEVSINDDDFQDFELDIPEDPPSELYGKKKRSRGKRKSSLKLILILAAFIMILLLAGAWLFFFEGLDFLSSNRSYFDNFINQVQSLIQSLLSMIK